MPLGEVVAVIRGVRHSRRDDGLPTNHRSWAADARARPVVGPCFTGRGKTLLASPGANRLDGCSGAAAREIAQERTNRRTTVRYERHGTAPQFVFRKARQSMQRISRDVVEISRTHAGARPLLAIKRRIVGTPQDRHAGRRSCSRASVRRPSGRARRMPVTLAERPGQSVPACTRIRRRRSPRSAGSPARTGKRVAAEPSCRAFAAYKRFPSMRSFCGTRFHASRVRAASNAAAFGTVVFAVTGAYPNANSSSRRSASHAASSAGGSLCHFPTLFGLNARLARTSSGGCAKVRSKRSRKSSRNCFGFVQHALVANVVSHALRHERTRRHTTRIAS